MGTMVPLPAPAGTPVGALAVSGGLVAALCGTEVVTGSLTDPGSWARLCPGAVDVALAGDRVVTAQGDNVVAIETATGRQVGRFGPTDAPLQGFAVSPDGRHVAVGEYRVVTVWGVATGSRLARWRAHDRVIPHLTFSPDGGVLATSSPRDRAVWRWRRWPRLRGRRDGTGPAAFAADGRLVGATGKAIGVWTPRGRHELTLPTDRNVRAVAVAPDGLRLAARHSEGVVALWSWPDGERLAAHRADRMAGGLAFTPDGTVLATGDDAALMTWGDGVPAPTPEAFVPRLAPTFDGHAPPSMLDWDRLTADAVEAAARAIPWLERLGAPSEHDGAAARIHDWDGWGGPEDRESEALSQRLLALSSPVARAVRGLHRPDVLARAEAIADVVRDRARRAAPYDDDADPWDGPWAAAATAWFVARMVSGYAAFGWPVPADLRALWGWFEAGHWPCAVRGGGLVVY